MMESIESTRSETFESGIQTRPRSSYEFVHIQGLLKTSTDIGNSLVNVVDSYPENMGRYQGLGTGAMSLIIESTSVNDKSDGLGIQQVEIRGILNRGDKTVTKKLQDLPSTGEDNITIPDSWFRIFGITASRYGSPYTIPIDDSGVISIFRAVSAQDETIAVIKSGYMESHTGFYTVPFGKILLLQNFTPSAISLDTFIGFSVIYSLDTKPSLSGAAGTSPFKNIFLRAVPLHGGSGDISLLDYNLAVTEDTDIVISVRNVRIGDATAAQVMPLVTGILADMPK